MHMHYQYYLHMHKHMWYFNTCIFILSYSYICICTSPPSTPAYAYASISMCLSFLTSFLIDTKKLESTTQYLWNYLINNLFVYSGHFVIQKGRGDIVFLFWNNKIGIKKFIIKSKSFDELILKMVYWIIAEVIGTSTNLEIVSVINNDCGKYFRSLIVEFFLLWEAGRRYYIGRHDTQI